MAKIKIVHLDDHTLYQQGVRTCLDPQKEKFFFMSFQHPDDALRYITNSFDNGCRIDVVITDLRHAGIDGYQFSKEIKRLDKIHNKTTPVILLSMCTNANVEPVEKGKAEGVFDFCLGKNADGKDILFAIDYLLSKDGKEKDKE